MFIAENELNYSNHTETRENTGKTERNVIVIYFFLLLGTIFAQTGCTLFMFAFPRKVFMTIALRVKFAKHRLSKN
jgi:hypothetical protein